MADSLWQYSHMWQLFHHIFAVTYLAVSAPLVMRVLIKSSWPYLAATWRGVLPSLSTQSISPPGRDFLTQDNVRIQVDSDTVIHSMLVSHVAQYWFLFYSVCFSALKYKNDFQGDKSSSAIGMLLNLHREKSIRNAFEKPLHIVLFKDLKRFSQLDSCSEGTKISNAIKRDSEDIFNLNFTCWIKDLCKSYITA